MQLLSTWTIRCVVVTWTLPRRHWEPSTHHQLSQTKISPVQFSRSVVSDSLRPHGLQHARLPCPSPTPRVCSNSCPLSRWCHPTISFSVVPFSSCLQSFPASGSFPMSVLSTRGPKYWSFSFSISPSDDYSGLISFRIEHSDKLMKYLLMCNFTIFI